MTLQELLTIANEGYPDGFLAEYFDAATGRPKAGSGDTLAEFVVNELSDTFDPEATDGVQIAEAVGQLQRAVRDLYGVMIALENSVPNATSGTRNA